MLMAFRKKIRAKLSAMTQEIPTAFSAIGACSRLEPHPKFRPATRMSPGLTFLENSGAMFSIACSPRTFGSIEPR